MDDCDGRLLKEGIEDGRVHVHLVLMFVLSCLCSCFQNNVEIHVAHIQSGLSQLGNLHAFAANNTNTV